MEFKSRILSNGLSVIGEVNKSAKSAAVGFFVKTGSRDESKEINGVSHFLEHMLFKGTPKLSALEVNEAFDRTGAQFNAFTSEENTVFYAAVLPEYLAEVTGIWTELMRPALRDADFDIEKNVIKEEIAMYKDMPQFDVVDRCRTLHFDGHPCGNSVLGSVENIDALTAVQMREYFGSRYAPNNLTVVFTGNFDWEKICSLMEAGGGKWWGESAPRQHSDCSPSKRQERIDKGNLVREHICLMSQGVSAQDDRRFAAALLANIVGDEVGSRYFWGLVDKALAETAVMQFEAMDGTGLFCSYIRCGSRNVSHVLETVAGVFADIAKRGVAEDELAKAKNKALSALVIKNELPMGRLIDVGFNWVYLGRHRRIEEDMNAIKAVTIDNVRSLIDDYKPGEFTQFSIGPCKSDQG